MNRKIAILIIILIILLLWLLGSNKEGGLVKPKFMGLQEPSPTPSATPAAPVTPKTFQFDSSTDLKAELEKVNPQILDSDFVE